MILLVDAGNSRIKWGVHDAGKWLHKDAVTKDGAVALAEAWSTYQPSWAGISNVAGGNVADAIRNALQPQCEVFWLRPETNAHGLRNPYPDLGSDRYAALVAAARMGLGSCVVASLGTALTADALTADGRFLGGLIAPGYGLMQRALREGTAAVRPGAGACVDFPNNTADAVETGIVTALAGAIEGMRTRMRQAGHDPVSVVLSGGDAGRLLPWLDAPVLQVEDLVLEGLLWIAKERGVLAG